MKVHTLLTALSLSLGFPPRRASVLAALMFGPLTGSSLHAANPTSMPPPGHYRIDAETTTTSRAGPTTLEVMQRVDGTTGGITVTRKSSGEPGNVATQTFAGTGPNRWCVPTGGKMPPAKSAQNVCQNARLTPTPAGSKLGADCTVGRVDEQWRRIDDRTWERLVTVRQAPSALSASTAANSSPLAAIEFAMRGMTPAQRAIAQAELAAMPSDADRAEAHGTLVAMIEQQARSDDAQEAAAARQQLTALGGSSPGGSAAVVVRTKERWSRIAETCSAGS